MINDDELYDDFAGMYDLLAEKLLNNADVAEEFYNGKISDANKDIAEMLDYLLDVIAYATGNEEEEEEGEGEDEYNPGEEDKKKEEE